MKKSAVLIIIIALIVAFFAAPYIAEYTSTASSESGETVSINIEKGSSVAAIGQVLKENGLIRSVNIFKMRVKAQNAAENLHYGTFELKKGMCIPDIITALSTKGAEAQSVKLTIPEGFSAEKIAAKLEEASICTKDEFLKALDDDYDFDFLKNIKKKDGVKYRLQGFLFPDTYNISKTATPHDIVSLLLSQFEKKLSGFDMKNSSYSLYDTITIASLIEREAKIADERKIISGVIYNRLKENMKLQICASVLYVITNGMYDVDTVLYKDLEVVSPYNTYKVSQLPCGPICSPGAASIEAALHPQSHSYLFYHTNEDKKDGSHIFTQTYSEHQITQ